MNWRKPLLLPAMRLKRNAIHRELRLLRSLQYKSASEINALHEKRLNQLLLHAWHHTEYYREVLDDCGAVRDGVVDLSRFEDIPILTKDIIRRQGKRLRAKQVPRERKPYVNRTGGSTGEPIEYWQDSHYWDVTIANKLYHFEVLGKHLGDPELKLWGSHGDISLETSTWKARLETYLYNRQILSCTRMTGPDIEAIVDEINRFRPRSIWGYIDGVYAVAERINKQGLRVHSPAAIFGGGGTMLPQMAASIRAAFGAPAVNFYGSREMGDVACECGETAGLHISSNSHKVEVVDENERTVMEHDGNLVLTSLHNYAMPFIRYQIGDRGRLTRRACLCGRGFPLLESVLGRGVESFVTRDGAVVSPISLIGQIRQLTMADVIDRIQYVQEDYTRVTVKVVPNPSATEDDLRANLDGVSARIRSIMGGDCRVNVERVSEIPPTASGKYLYTISKVRPQLEPEAHVA